MDMDLLCLAYLTCVGAEDQQQRDDHAEDGDQVLFFAFGWFGNEK